MSVKSNFWLFLFGLILQASPVHGAGLDDADERLFQVQLAMAEQGNTRAQYYLGEMHEQGLGTKQDVDEAFKWYTKAAEQGDPLAQRKLAHRQEIINEIRKEQDLETLKTPPMPAKPKKAQAPSKSPVQTAPVAVAQTDQAQEEKDRIKALAEREKRRAAVRKMILERIRNPVGSPFGE